MQVTQSNYAALKAALEAIGFNNLPAESDIVWTAANPCSLNATLVFKKNVLTAESRALTP